MAGVFGSDEGAAVQTVATPFGSARVESHRAAESRATLLLGHGAGGGITAPDLVTAARAALDVGVHVGLVEQPYRVAGRRLPPNVKQLDEAWLAVVEALRVGPLGDSPLIFGGRSSGARVACRTAAAGRAMGVLCLAFPEHPPGKPEKSRQVELTDVAVPALVVQGETDPFGCPVVSGHQELVVLRGDHSLKADLPGLYRVVRDWLRRVCR